MSEGGMDKGGWAMKVERREVWIEDAPEADLLTVCCPELPGYVALVNSLDDAVLRMEEMIEARTEQQG
jgi:predicted RNase H-like HicB family nuclease